MEEVILSLGIDLNGAEGKLDKLGNSIGKVDSQSRKAEKSGKGFLGGITSFIGKVGGLGSSILGLAGGFGVAGAGISKVTDFLGDSAKAAREEQAQIAHLTSTLKANVPGWDNNVDAIEKYVSSMEGMTAFSDGDVRASFEALAFRTHDVAKAQEAQAAAFDLSRQKGLTLAQATEYIGKAMDGNVGPLRKLGIELDRNAKSGEVLTAIQNQMGDAAENYGNSALGTADKSKNAWANIQESVGAALTPILDFGTQFLSVIVNGVGTGISDLSAKLQPFFDTMGQLFDAIGQAVRGDGAALMQFFKDLGGPFEAVGVFLTNIISNFRTFIETITTGGDPIQAFLDLIGGNLGALGTMIGDVGTWFMGALPGILAALGEWAAGVLRWLSDNAPIWAAQFGEWASGTWSWLVENIPTWVVEAGKFLVAVLQWVADNAPKFAEAMWEWGVGLYNWVTPQIPKWIEAADQFMDEILRWTVIGAIKLTEATGEWAHSFILWIPKAIGAIGAELGKFLINLSSWIVFTATPAITKELGAWVLSFSVWVTQDAWPALNAELGKLLLSLSAWVVDVAVPAIVGALDSWVRAFTDWAGQVWAGLLVGLNELASSIWSWVAQTASEAFTKALDIGRQLVAGMIQGIVDNRNLLPADMRNLIELALTAAENQAETKSPSKRTARIGLWMVQGFAQGIALNAHIAAAAARAMAAAAIAAAQEALDSHSPSRVMAGIGQDMVSGLVMGALDAAPKFYRSLGGIMAGARAVVAGGLGTAHVGVAGGGTVSSLTPISNSNGNSALGPSSMSAYATAAPQPTIVVYVQDPTTGQYRRAGSNLVKTVTRSLRARDTLRHPV